MKAVAQSSPGLLRRLGSFGDAASAMASAGSSSSPTPKSPGGGLQSKLSSPNRLSRSSASMGGANSAFASSAQPPPDSHVPSQPTTPGGVRRTSSLSILSEPNSMWSVRTSLGTTSGRSEGGGGEGTSMRSDGSGSSAAPPSPKTESQTTTSALPWELNLRRSKSTSPKEKSPPQSPSQQSQQQHGFRRKMKTTVAVPAGDASAATSTQPKLPSPLGVRPTTAAAAASSECCGGPGQQEGSTQSSPNSTPEGSPGAQRTMAAASGEQQLRSSPKANTSKSPSPGGRKSSSMFRRSLARPAESKEVTAEAAQVDLTDFCDVHLASAPPSLLLQPPVDEQQHTASPLQPPVQPVSVSPIQLPPPSAGGVLSESGGSSAGDSPMSLRKGAGIAMQSIINSPRSMRRLLSWPPGNANASGSSGTGSAAAEGGGGASSRSPGRSASNSPTESTSPPPMPTNHPAVRLSKEEMWPTMWGGGGGGGSPSSTPNTPVLPLDKRSEELRKEPEGFAVASPTARRVTAATRARDLAVGLDDPDMPSMF